MSDATLHDGLAWRSWPAQGPSRGRLVLLHGFAGDGLTWAALAPLLAAKGWHCSAPDLPAHGESSLEAATAAELLALLAPRLPRDEPYGLIGHSLGGALSIELAALGSLPITGLTLLSPAGIGPEIDGGFLRHLARIATGAELQAALARLAVQPPSLPPEVLDSLAQTLGPRGRLLALADSLADGDRQRLDVLPALARLTLPVRIGVGLRDDLIPWTQVANLPPRVAVHLLRDSKHLPHWDQAADVAALFEPAGEEGAPSP